MTQIHKRLGDILVEVGLVTPDQLSRALEDQKRTGNKLGMILSGMGAINEEVMLGFLAKQLGVSYISLAEYGEIPSETIRSVPEKLIRANDIIPIAREGSLLTLAMADPFNAFVIDDVKVTTGCEVKIVIAAAAEIRSAIHRFFDTALVADEVLVAIPEDETFVAAFIGPAVRAGASAVHVESDQDGARVRFRIDGRLHDRGRLGSGAATAAATRLRRLADPRAPSLGVTEGSFDVFIDGERFAVRFAAIPTIAGERITLQIAARDLSRLPLDRLGLEGDVLERVRRFVEIRAGLFIVAGPVDAGKTTTLYALCAYLARKDRDIIAIEDPIEADIPGVSQVSWPVLHEQRGGNALNAVRRQNPDMFMFGDVRTSEQARLSVEFAHSGRLVLAGLSAPGSVEAVLRLSGFGLDPAALSGALSAVLAQRLVRIVCQDCRESYEASAVTLRKAGVDPEYLGNRESLKLVRGIGCEKCGHTGYRGRIAVFELLDVTEHIRYLVRERAPSSVISEAARMSGMPTLRRSAWNAVLAGVTTVEEMLRIMRS